MSYTLLRTSRVTVFHVRSRSGTVSMRATVGSTFDDPTIIDSPVRFNSSLPLKRKVLDPTLIDGPAYRSRAMRSYSNATILNDPTIIDGSLSARANDPTIIDCPKNGFLPIIEDPTIIDDRINV
eukprot:CAMPEP_0204621940 /NCGR_PEP_ID=MMETSP0717-20131115/7596_1 /ASSEMBLY_ACC=CAM_ASM_000666 /TAXON_ID=230516 /ORGANISM="Chaetoceros curvisetus" /LENGTH=123 /DNA_ID=CAMNT_0051636505 /DNA_START=58 /DNA_END=429 /DNA_ORIENTATION=+